MLPMQIVPAIAQRVGWRWAFAVLSIGPALGIFAIRRLSALRRGTPEALSSS
jgi:hypothetical protein